ncbi:MAG: amidohydrolase family protein, partial [Lentisphaerae bacterium]|nr:amidohydrolase family protein [Lentisphaerota bacterium]
MNSRDRLDIKIVGGTIIDGSGTQPVTGDVGIVGDRITAIGDLSGLDAIHRINAAAHVVCPGFIDVHTHSDFNILLQPFSLSKIYQGVTTEIVGNCGSSVAPIKDVMQLSEEIRKHGYDIKWRSVAEYMDSVEEAEPAVNIGVLVGHGRLRSTVLSYDAREADSGEMLEMTKLLDEDLAAGAIGFTSGLIYPPGM